MDWTVWGPPIAVLVVGLLVGGGLALSLRGRWTHDPRRADLLARKEILLAQLRDVEGDRAKLDETTWNERREALLDQAARVLRELEDPASPPPPTESEVHEGNHHLKWYGLGLLVFFLVSGVALSQALAPRQDEAMGVASSSDPVAEAEAAFAANPQDIDACNILTKASIYTGQTMEALERLDQCRAIDPEHPVVHAHNAAMFLAIYRLDEAAALLDPHMLAPNPPWEVVLWSGLVELNQGKIDQGLEHLQQVADNSEDELDVGFARFVLADVRSNQVGASEPQVPEAGTIRASGTILGEIEPGGVLFVYVKSAPQDAGSPMVARRYADWSLPMDFELGDGNLLPFAGGAWPEPAWIKVKIARSGDPKVASEGDIQSEWLAIEDASALSITLGD